MKYVNEKCILTHFVGISCNGEEKHDHGEDEYALHVYD